MNMNDYTLRGNTLQDFDPAIWCSNDQQDIPLSQVNPAKYLITYIDHCGNERQAAETKHLCPICGKPLGVGVKGTHFTSIIRIPNS